MWQYEPSLQLRRLPGRSLVVPEKIVTPFERGDRRRQGEVLIRVDYPKRELARARAQCLGPEPLRRGGRAPGRQVKVQGIPTGGHIPVQVTPPPAYAQIGLVDTPRLCPPLGDAPVPASLPVQLRAI